MLNPKIINQYKNRKVDAASDMPDIRGKNILMGFWHNWPSEPGQGYQQGLFKEMALTDIPEAYNVVAVAFMKGAGIPTFKPYNLSDDAFRAQVAALNAQGRAVIISLGGADAHIELHEGQEDALAYEIIRLVEVYGFDGLDIDLEQAAITFADNRTVLPAALRLVRKHYEAEGKHFIISMAPEFPYLRAAGSYLAYINALEDLYDFIAPQYYNQGGDGIWVDELNLWVTQNNNTQKKAFLYYLTDSLIHGTRGYASIPADRLAIGLPSNNDGAATGYVVNPQDVKDALQELKDAGNPIRGLMTWSVNWDAGKDKNGKEYNWEFVNRYGYLTGGETPVPGKPSVPADLTLSWQTKDSITLIWRLSEGAHPVRIYNLFRNGALVGTPTAPPFFDTDVSPGAIYDYQISATDIEGNTSNLSTVLTVYMDQNQPPSAPTDLKATDISAYSVSLEWTASTGLYPIRQYLVHRNQMRIAIVTSPQTTYTDAGLTSATDYTYQIIAHDEKDGVSAGSEPLTVTTESENGGGVTAWAPGVQYQIDHLVTHQGISYKCRQSHKSIPEWSPEKPGSESLWLLLGRSAGSKH
ncbi:glycosyl hydrolase family 18 protein [Pseudomonas syringae pv. actinidiae]|uniref:fibronectin type III domain-containing protein n=1 Tax=Pseudomonas syringae TaxID=317 RepID=UPI0004635E87|nr:glycosyl hydrolase family 18 protein [Pseudomonas syringae]AYL78924.1 chitinase [Pseudomonas syringae pv. actinidiae str. Shaanxi_M228]MDU8266873.1 glycosyl hydrolase family 18 protein [Pseudomonas syringae pv. actinidiae]MDU8283264.1 glycosyl hydrolase family 18 protein [Pseudomonas syringae pv. actinidiae]MDU8304201.1 glycosyl hydrolase family 18 protein [Pseudomonas syringae pv. actinidiae]MDU8613318.1 glycosyl hydrolase family 18 protein [Pseudomonas syringae pv. actinidiae]